MKNNLKILILIPIIIIVGAFAYYYANIKTPTETTTPIATNDSAVGCYVAKLSKDVYTLEIKSNNNGAITGILAYNNYEKDSSSGTFNGTLSGDILIGTYSFDSEGTTSSRQLIFKKINNGFIEGFGDITTAGNAETLVNTGSVTYDPNSTFIKSETCTENFTASKGSFSFDHNAFFQAMSGTGTPSMDWEMNAKQNGLLLAIVNVPRSYMPKTNFSEAKLTIGESSDTNAVKNCLADTSGGMNINGVPTTVSGYPFTKFTFEDAGAGNFYETTSYRSVLNGNCYAIEYTIHSTNIGNYSPDQGITEFDKTKITNDLESIVKSLRLIVASN